MKKLLPAAFLLIFFSTALRAQMSDIWNKSEVHGSFEVDGQYYHADEPLGIYDSLINGRVFGFNGFADLTYSLGNFSAGLRYEAYLPPMAGFDSRLEGNGFPHMWASYSTERFSFTVGNFYEQFGNGLTLRSYWEWTLAYDNSINGAKIQFEPVKGLIIKGVYGTQRFFWSKYTKNSRGIVKGLDAELDFNQAYEKFANSKLRMSIGASAVSKYQRDDNHTYKMPRNVGNFAGRIALGYGKFNFNAEYAYKINDPSAVNNYIYKPGESLMASLSYSTRGLGVFLMFKRLDNMSFKSDHSATGNVLDINFLPPLTDPHTYSLMAMYPYATQPNGEMGIQLQINYKIPRKSKLGGKYGTNISFNYSQVNDIVRNPASDTTAIGVGGTLGYTSPFFEFGDKVLYRDLNLEIERKFNRKFKGLVKYMYQEFDMAIQGHAEKGVVFSNIAVVDMTYKFTSKKALRCELQGLWTEEDKGNWAAILLEYTVSPHWFFNLQDQYNYGNPLSKERLHYYTGAFGYTMGATRFSISYGRQREGVVCVGGVCRVVPVSSGFYVTISSNF